MDLQEKQIMLENIISEIISKGHDDNLLQQLIRCYLDIYLARDYQSLGYLIDVFQNADPNLCGNFFGQVIKTGERTSAEDGSLGNKFANNFCSSVIHTLIKGNESLKQIYLGLGVIDDYSDKGPQFWWDRVVSSLADFDFQDLCLVTPDLCLTGGRLQRYIIRENNLRALLNEKGISEEDYSIDYGTIYDSGFSLVNSPAYDISREIFRKQQQRGLYLHKPKNGTTCQ